MTYVSGDGGDGRVHVYVTFHNTLQYNDAMRVYRRGYFVH